MKETLHDRWHEDDRLGNVYVYVLLMLPLCIIAYYLAMHLAMAPERWDRLE